jgi:hypothetical protein
MLQLVTSPQLTVKDDLGKHRLADPDLLQTIAERCDLGEASDALSNQFSRVLHDIRMAGAWKRTDRGRLRQTEEMIGRHLAGRFRDKTELLDLGASDGITSLDALRSLQNRIGGEVRVVLADINLWLLRYRRGPVVEYRASNGEPVMVRVGRLGLRLSGSRRRLNERQDPLARAYLGLLGFRRSMRFDARLSLVNPIVRSEKCIEIMELDCLIRDEALVGRFSAVRASNVLNLGYFTPPQVMQVVGHIHAYLQDGGCLIVSRNRDQEKGREIEDGSIWLRNGAGFSWVADFGAGSEIRFVVEGWGRS